MFDKLLEVSVDISTELVTPMIMELPDAGRIRRRRGDLTRCDPIAKLDVLFEQGDDNL